VSGASVTELLQSRGDPIEQSPIVRGEISTNRPAPTGFPKVGSEENLLWVVTAETSVDRPLGPCWWNADHGVTLPAQGAKCVLVMDNKGIATVIWWAANHS
jgi:hypothetical protein